MIEKGNMTDAEYIAALIIENKKLKAEKAKLEKKMGILENKTEKLSVENIDHRCLDSSASGNSES